MPFMGRDWRSPGEAWVKTETLGWQRMKIIESQLYLTSCPSAGHAAACSWPPKSQFGQHMADNCVAGRADQAATVAGNNMNCDQTDGEAGVVDGLLCCRRRAANSVDDDETGSSSSGSGRSSASTSPTSSPEKNNNGSAAVNATYPHIHRPITISSPYGRYSASCCGRHFHPASPTTTTTTVAAGSPSAAAAATNHCEIHRAAPRSLSRQSMDLWSGGNGGGPQQSETNDGRLTMAARPTLRPNRSEPNFRNSTNAPDNIQSGQAESVQQQQQQDACGHSPQPPKLLRNGLEINTNDDDGCDSELSFKSQPASPAARSVASSSSLAPSDRQQNHDNGQSSSAAGCNCCCCCSCDPSRQLPKNAVATSSPMAAAAATATTSVSSGQLNVTERAKLRQQPAQMSAPHCRISVRTREVAMHNTISEAFYRLDFYNAIHDIRRFNYICKLLHLLITQNLTSLSGCATRVLFTMLEQVAWEVSANKRNINVIRNLLAELRQTIQKYYCWGRPIGSSLLWQQHFETIERISQIVDEIELAPAKSNDDCQVTFERLPVEMIREILLRLNDYRDLVNSAQASPVMRTMIDNQCVWQKMCRYHFTDQQLKLAFESNRFNLVKERQGTSQLRGIKYARTTSADGRSSYRSPVAANQAVHREGEGAPQASPANDSQQQRQSSSRQTTPTSNDDERRPPSSRSDLSNSSSSYVTNAVRIFDRERSSSSSSSRHESCRRQASPSSSSSSSRSPLPAAAAAAAAAERIANEAASGAAPARHASEIDWERVFHQLRKRFDLKEEYADCLLLCRHCRCLFWKSFGHPCIKSDEPLERASECCQASGPNNANGAAATTTNNSKANCDCRVGASNRATEPKSSSSSSSVTNRRISVALLSRNFDRRALGSAHEEPPFASNNRENILVANEDEAEQDDPLLGRRGAAASRLPRRSMDGQLAARRPPLANLNAQLREHNANRPRRQDWQDEQLQQQQQQDPGRLDVARGGGGGGGLSSRPGGARARSDAKSAGEELVPKHVTISPQAFLKFFSL